MVRRIDTFVENLETFFTLHPVFSIFLGLMAIILVGLVIWGMVLVCVCVCARYSCCKRRVYYVNKKDDPENAIHMSELSQSQPEPRQSIDIERKKKEERHPGQTRKKVMLVDDDGNLPPYTLRSRSVDGGDDRYTTYMNVNVGKGMRKETEL